MLLAAGTNLLGLLAPCRASGRGSYRSSGSDEATLWHAQEKPRSMQMQRGIIVVCMYVSWTETEEGSV